MIVGIDLGTTNSLIGAMDAGFPLLFADGSGSRLTPSVVRYTPQGLAAVGRDALGGVHSIKRLMGRRVGEIDTELNVVGSKDEAVKVEIAGRSYSPEEVSAEILKKLKADAERVLGEPVVRAVITVPACFNDAQRAATKRAGELAGFTVERLVAEPTAAALAYGLERLGEKSKVAVLISGVGRSISRFWN